MYLYQTQLSMDEIGYRTLYIRFNDPDDFESIDKVADSYRNKGDYTGAIWFYSEALAMRRRRLEQKSRNSGKRDSSEVLDIGRTLTSIAVLRRERREFGAAKILFDEVKELYKSVGLTADHPFYRDLTQDIDVMRKM